MKKEGKTAHLGAAITFSIGAADLLSIFFMLCRACKKRVKREGERNDNLPSIPSFGA